MRREFPILVLAAVLLADVHAATFTVNNTDVDLGDLHPGDGECAWATFVPPEERCTLRAAIMEANALPGADVINIPGGVHIVLDRAGRNEDAAATGDLDITDPVTIQGPGGDASLRPIIDADSIDRVFDIGGNAGTVTLSHLVIRNGAANDTTSYEGGGIRAYGSGTLTVDSCEIVDNVANSGGGIYVATSLGRSLNLYDSTLHANGVFDFGVTNPFGSAIRSSDFAGPAGVSITIRRSTIYANLAFGSAFRAAVQVDYAPVVIENSTFSANLPNAISVYGSDATLNQVTITGSEVGYHFGGLSLGDFSSINNTIIAGNTSEDCTFAGSYGYSHNYTLDSDATCNLFGFGTGNLPMTNPLLGPLAIRYGDTPVHDLGAGSPAIDSADPVLQGSGGTCLGSDQDDIDRPLDGNGNGARCDMGAVEFVDAIFADGFEGPPR